MRQTIKAVDISSEGLLLVSETGERWMPPGGKPEEGDSSHRATLEREIREELNCHLALEPWELVHKVVSLSERHGLPTEHVYYRVRVVGAPEPAEEIGRWCRSLEPEELVIGHATRELVKTLRHRGLLPPPKPIITTQFPH